MINCPTITDLRQQLQQIRARGEKVAFVPTMGNLHAGHLTLVNHAHSYADRVVVSIFVNPLQFGANEDYSTYPRTLQQDIAGLEQHGCELLFTPDVAELYPQGVSQQTKVQAGSLASDLCGKTRPGHFDGVVTVVAKLLHIVQPDVALFGNKDRQQLYIIQQMVADLNFPLHIVGVDTVRDNDGLALSSRNGYLTAEQRRIAPVIYRTMLTIAESLDRGVIDYQMLQTNAAIQLQQHGFVVDYVAIRSAADLTEVVEPQDRLVILIAARLGATRLIDNLYWQRNLR